MSSGKINLDQRKWERDRGMPEIGSVLLEGFPGLLLVFELVPQVSLYILETSGSKERTDPTRAYR